MSVHGNSFGNTFVDWSDELLYSQNYQSLLLILTTVEPPCAITSPKRSPVDFPNPNLTAGTSRKLLVSYRDHFSEMTV